MNMPTERESVKISIELSDIFGIQEIIIMGFFIIFRI